MIEFVGKGFGEAEWRSVFDSLHGQSLLQTWTYGEAKARTGPWRIERGVFRRDGEIIGACQMMLRDVPIFSGGLAWAGRGPLFRDSHDVAEMCTVLAEQYCEERGYYLRLAPPVGADEFPQAAVRQAGFGDTETAGWEDVAIWQNPSPLTYAPLVSVSRSSSGNFRYRASYETGLDAWIDTGIAYQTGVWYHLGWDMNPADSSFLLYISTGDFTAPVASGSYSSVPAWLGSMYFSSWSANPEYYIDDVKIVGDFQPLPICGDVDHPYPPGDLTLDCYVNLADLALFAANWQDCTEPNAPCNYIPPAP